MRNSLAIRRRYRVYITLIEQSLLSAFTGTDTDNILHGIDENHAIALPASTGCLLDRLDSPFYVMLAKDNVEL